MALDNGDLRRGSGVVLHASNLTHSYLLTCHPVLLTPADAAAAVVKFRYRRVRDVPEQVTPLPDVLFITSQRLDYTLVAIPPHPHLPPDVVPPSCPPRRTEAEVEKGIYPLSHPHGAPLHISLAGRRVAVEKVDWKTQVAFTSEVHVGSSGGGVYDTQTGALITLITHEHAEYNVGTNVKVIWRDAELRVSMHVDVQVTAVGRSLATTTGTLGTSRRYWTSFDVVRKRGE